MRATVLGRIVGERLELDEPLTGLADTRVRVTLEVIASEDDEHPAVRAWAGSSPDERPTTAEERASFDAAKRDPRRLTTEEEEVRSRLASARCTHVSTSKTVYFPLSA